MDRRRSAALLTITFALLPACRLKCPPLSSPPTAAPAQLSDAASTLNLSASVGFGVTTTAELSQGTGEAPVTGTITLAPPLSPVSSTCPVFSATATANGIPMTTTSSGGVAGGEQNAGDECSTPYSCGGMMFTLQAPAASTTWEFLISDASATLVMNVDGAITKATVGTDGSNTLAPGATLSFDVSPPLAPLGSNGEVLVDLGTAWTPQSYHGVNRPDGFSFTIPSTAATPMCESSGTCNQTMMLTFINAWPATVSTCTGVASCTFGSEVFVFVAAT